MMMGKNRIRLCGVVLVLCLLVGMLGGCSSKRHIPAIEQRVQDFVIKCNNLDIDGILRCIDPSLAEPVALVIGGIELASKLSGNPVDKDMLIAEVCNCLMDESGIDARPFCQSIQVDIQKVEMDGNNYAYVFSNISYVIAGFRFTKEGVIHMTEQAETWYIAWLEFSMFE